MALLGFGYRCQAAVGDGDFRLTGTIDIGTEGEVLGSTAGSAQVLANPAQVVRSGVASQPWEFIGTLRWSFYTHASGYDLKAGGPSILTDNARIMLQLTPQKPMPEPLVIAFTGRSNGAAMISGGYSLKGIGTFYIHPQELLGFDGPHWIVSKWPYQGEGTAIKKRYGSGNLKLDRVRAVLANVDPLNVALAEILRDYKNRCTPVPTYEDNSIIV